MTLTPVGELTPDNMAFRDDETGLEFRLTDAKLASGSVRATVTAVFNGAHVGRDNLLLADRPRRRVLAKEIAGNTTLDDAQADNLLVDLEDAAKEFLTSCSSTERGEKFKLTARFPGLIDIVEHDGKPHFLLVENSELCIRDCHEGQGPPDKEHLPFLLPRYEGVRAAYESDSDEALFKDLVQYHRNISQLPTEDHYPLLAAFGAHTYLLEKWRHSPMLEMFATPERGKTLTGIGITHVAYRGVHTETVNEANLFRWSNDLGATLFLDVRDLWKKALKRNSDDILLQRFANGARVSRVLYPEKGPFEDTRYFDTYGPTIIATNEPIHNVLESRCLVIVMPDADRDYTGEILPEKALPLKDRLVAFRARHLGGELAYIQKPCDGRLGDILRPIGTIINLMCPSYMPSFKRLVRGFLASRQEEKAGTVEARIIEVMLELYDKVREGKILVSAITDKINEGLPENRQYGSRAIGHRIRALGFEGARTNRAKGYVYDFEKLNHLAKKYGVSPELSSAPSAPLDIKQIGADGGAEVDGGADVGADVSAQLTLSGPDTNGADDAESAVISPPAPPGEKRGGAFDRAGAIAYVMSVAETMEFPLDGGYRIGPGKRGYERRLNSMGDDEIKAMSEALEERLGQGTPIE